MSLRQISLSSAGSLTIAVICLVFFCFQGWLYLRKREMVHNGWGAILSLSTSLYAVGVFIQFNAPQGPVNVLAERIQYSGILLVVYSMYGFTLPFYGRSSRLFHRVVGPVSLGVLGLIWLTDLIIAEGPFVHRSFAWLAEPYVEPVLGRLGPAFLACAATSVIGPFWLWLKQPGRRASGGNTIIVALAIWALLGAHDAVATMFNLRTVQFLMEYGSLAYAAGVLSVTVAEHLRLYGEIDARDDSLAQERGRLEATLRSMAEAFIATDVEGRIVLFNPSAERLSGWTADQALGENVEVVLRSCHQDPPKRKGPGGQKRPFHLSGTFVAADGERRHVVQTRSPIHDRRGEVIGQVYVLRDETERRQLRRQVERGKRMEALGLLAGGVAHDLNNLLAGLVAYPDALLSQMPDGHPMRGAVKTIKHAGEKAAALVHDLLTMARGSAATLEPMDVNSVVSDLAKGLEIQSFRETYPQVELCFDLTPKTAKVMGSRYRLSRALTNLIQNAVEASPSGAKVHISTNVRRLESAHMGYEKVPTGEYVTATVLDEGEGILAEDLEKIFEPFYTTKKMGRSGTGLGMAVVYGAVKDHDGYIDVASGLEGGTCITLFIPTRPRAKRAADRQTPSTEDGVAEC